MFWIVGIYWLLFQGKKIEYLRNKSLRKSEVCKTYSVFSIKVNLPNVVAMLDGLFISKTRYSWLINKLWDNNTSYDTNKSYPFISFKPWYTTIITKTSLLSFSFNLFHWISLFVDSTFTDKLLNNKMWEQKDKRKLKVGDGIYSPSLG